jgi:chemotaxis response regulator CheB
MIRVLIVRDSLASHKIIRELFEAEADFEICDEADRGADAVYKAALFSPNLILLHSSEHWRDDLEFLRKLRDAIPNTPILVLTDGYDAGAEKTALTSGATAVFSMANSLTTLILNARAILER